MAHLMHALQLLGLALDPSAPPLQLHGDSTTLFLSASVLQQISEGQQNKWACHRAQLGHVGEVSHPRPLHFLGEELKDCVLEEHDLAAELISCNEEGLCSLGVVQAALKKWYGLSERSEFNPITEYANIQQICSGWTVDHKELAGTKCRFHDYSECR